MILFMEEHDLWKLLHDDESVIREILKGLKAGHLCSPLCYKILNI